jgi:hypothetical protein
MAGCVPRTRSVFILSAFIFSTFTASICQLAETTPPPPAHLPRLIGECETSANYAACSLWIWHGSSYSAIWQNGAVGELTVASGDSSDLRIERKDSAGPVAGLTATYTAKWDGKTFSDGAIAATLNGGTNQLTWIGSAAVTPVLANPTLDYSYVNWYMAPLTGYAIYSNKGSFNMGMGTEINDYRMRGEGPMNPGESRLFTQQYFVAAPNYGKGVTYPQAASIAAIYADGTTFGDANVLKLMLERRQAMIEPLTSIAATLCAMGMQSASMADISAALNKQQTAEDARSPAGKVERSEAYLFVQKSLNGRTNSHMTASKGAKRTWDQVNQLRSGLAADPVKDGGGNLVVPAVTPLACNLP